MDERRQKVGKDLAYYLGLDYPITITKDIDEGEIYYEAEIPDLPGCGAHGKTVDEAIENLEEAKKLWLEVSLERNLPIPEPVAEDEFSGKFLLRIPPRLHMELSQNAKKEGLSLNQYIRRILEEALALGNILERLETIELEVKRIQEKMEESKQTRTIIWNVEAYQSGWPRFSSSEKSARDLTATNEIIETA